MQRLTLALCAFLLVLAAGPVVKAQNNTTNIYDTLRARNLTGLVALINAAGLRSTLSNPNLNITLFAPTNDAVDEFNSSAIDLGLNVSALLTPVLLYHASPNTSITFRDNLVLPTLLASQNLTNTTTNIVVRNYTSGIWYLGGIISGALLNTSDRIPVGRSQIYVIDSVLVPPSTRLLNVSLTLDAQLRSDGNFTILRRLIASEPTFNRIAIDPNLAVTFFAPTDAAFNALFNATNTTLAGVSGTALARRILESHLVPALPVTTLDFGDAIELPSAGNQTIITFETVFTDEETSFTVKGVGNTSPITVINPDVPVAMSAVHVINGVILPNLNATTNSTRPAGRRRMISLKQAVRNGA